MRNHLQYEVNSSLKSVGVGQGLLHVLPLVEARLLNEEQGPLFGGTFINSHWN